MLKWSSDYDTGVPSVDADHRKLVEGLNQLEMALATGRGSKEIPALLAFLEEYATGHFAREESCMNRMRCPTAAANKAAHQEFIATFGKAKQKIATSSGSAALVAMQVHRELCDWMVNHILRIDTALRICKPPAGVLVR